MDVTSKPLHDDSGNVTITPEMLDAHKPDELRRLEDFDSNAVFAYTLNVYEDDLLLDCFDAAAGEFLGDEAFDCAELRILIDKAGHRPEWYVIGPRCPTTIGRRYSLPRDMAYAIRFLEDYVELDMRLPLTGVRLSDSVCLGPDGVQLNGMTMNLKYPVHTSLIEIKPDLAGNCMG
jgi:hypothetical protein